MPDSSYHAAYFCPSHRPALSILVSFLFTLLPTSSITEFAGRRDIKPPSEPSIAFCKSNCQLQLLPGYPANMVRFPISSGYEPLTDTMVSLDAVKKEEPSLQQILGDLKGVQLGPKGSKLDESDDTAVSVYGSSFASHGLPTSTLPESSMPKEIAYRMIK